MDDSLAMSLNAEPIRTSRLHLPKDLSAVSKDVEIASLQEQIGQLQNQLTQTELLLDDLYLAYADLSATSKPTAKSASVRKTPDLSGLVQEQVRQIAGGRAAVQATRAKASWKVASLLRALERLLDRTMKTDLQKHRFLVETSNYFDSDWYADAYPDVGKSNLKPIIHFMKFGAKELRDPGPHFSSKLYLEENTDLQSKKVIPIIHYLNYGMNEGRIARPSWIKRGSHDSD